MGKANCFLVGLFICALCACMQSCDDDEQGLKTPGKINAEKIESLLEKPGYQPTADIYFNGGRSLSNSKFYVEDQFMYVLTGGVNSYDLILDLNHLVSIDISGGRFKFHFSNYQ